MVLAPPSTTVTAASAQQLWVLDVRGIFGSTKSFSTYLQILCFGVSRRLPNIDQCPTGVSYCSCAQGHIHTAQIIHCLAIANWPPLKQRRTDRRELGRPIGLRKSASLRFKKRSNSTSCYDMQNTPDEQNHPTEREHGDLNILWRSPLDLRICLGCFLT